MRKFKSILLIDDDEISNFLCEETIKSNQIAEKVLAFDNADDALNFLSSTNEQTIPEVIFLDINMPGMDGWEFLEDFKKISSYIKNKVTVIILSSSKYKLDLEKAGGFLEVADYVSKPLTPEILTEILNKYSPKYSACS